MKINELHIGKLIKDIVREKGIKDVDFAKLIHRSKQNVYDMYKRSDMEVKLLLTCSEVLDHNFFEDIYPSKKTELNKAIDLVFDTMKVIVKEKTNC